MQIHTQNAYANTYTAYAICKYIHGYFFAVLDVSTLTTLFGVNLSIYICIQTLPDDQAKVNLVNPVMYFAAGCAWMHPPPLPGTGTSNMLLVLLMF
jgi:hypothetical protein